MSQTKPILVNVSTCRKYLRSTGLRASPEAITMFQQEIAAMLQDAANKIAAKTIERKSKTMKEEDIVLALKSS